MHSKEPCAVPLGLASSFVNDYRAFQVDDLHMTGALASRQCAKSSWAVSTSKRRLSQTQCFNDIVQLLFLFSRTNSRCSHCNRKYIQSINRHRSYRVAYCHVSLHLLRIQCSMVQYTVWAMQRDLQSTYRINTYSTARSAATGSIRSSCYSLRQSILKVKI